MFFFQLTNGDVYLMYDMNIFVWGSLETSRLGIFHTVHGNGSLPPGTYNIYFLGKIRKLDSVILGFDV